MHELLLGFGESHLALPAREERDAMIASKARVEARVVRKREVDTSCLIS